MPYLTAAQVESEMTALAAGSGGVCMKLVLPHPTVSEGAGPTTYSYLRIAQGAAAGRVAVLAVAGMHAREWAQPDAVISFAKKLVAAYRGSTSFTIPAYTDKGGTTFSPIPVSAGTVKRLIDQLDILLLPLANPDGRAFSQKAPANSGWRKNRAPRPVAGGDDKTVGVDLNRNFDIAWDYELYFNAAFAASPDLSASKNPADFRFIGKPLAASPSRPDSEPEVRNVISILDNNPVTYCVDLHSFSMLVMHPWGIERNGSVAMQNFQNAAFNHVRDGTLGNAYSEFFPNAAPSRLLDRHALLVGSMRDGIRGATGRDYTTGGIADTIYPATGSFSDYAFSRQFKTPGAPAVHSFAVEFGDAADNFQPLYDDPHGYPRIEREVHATLLKLLEAALPPAVTPVGGSGGSGGGKKGCFFSVAVEGLGAGAAWLETLRRGRAALLAGRRTRSATLALDRAYRRLSAYTSPRIEGVDWACRAIAYGFVAPAAALTSLALPRARR